MITIYYETREEWEFGQNGHGLSSARRLSENSRCGNPACMLACPATPQYNW